MQKNSDFLRLLAMISMLIDHMGVMIFPDTMILRYIGRLAFPLFLWYLCLGVKRTSNFKKYMTRMLGLAIISQVPYMYLNPDLVLMPTKLNIMFTLMLSALLIRVVTSNEPKILRITTTFIIVLLPLVVRVMLGIKFSYGSYGMLLTLAIYCLTINRRLMGSLLWLLANGFYGLEVVTTYALMNEAVSLSMIFNLEVKTMRFLQYSTTQALSILALPFILFPSQFLVKRIPKWLSYGFYPVHMVILIGVTILL